MCGSRPMATPTDCPTCVPTPITARATRASCSGRPYVARPDRQLGRVPARLVADPARTSRSTPACATRSSGCATPRISQNTIDPLTGELRGTNAMHAERTCGRRASASSTTGPTRAAPRSTATGAASTSRSRWTSTAQFGGETTYRQRLRSGAVRRLRRGHRRARRDRLRGERRGCRCLARTCSAPACSSRPASRRSTWTRRSLGVEYEVIDDLKLGVSFQNRRLGRVIEDVSTDGAETYIIANPGEWSARRRRLACAPQIERDRPIQRSASGSSTSSSCSAASAIFDKPRRDYNALQCTR